MRLELTKRGDYGVRAMLAIAEVADGEPGTYLSTSRIAAVMAVPPRILPSVMSLLVRAGLVGAQEGRAGGYALAHPATSISILSIIEAVEGDMHRQRCILRGGPCGSGRVCSVHDVFLRAEDTLRFELGTASLADIRPARSSR